MLDSDPSDMSPMNFCLLHEETIKTPSPVTVPYGIPSIHFVTEDILHFTNVSAIPRNHMEQCVVGMTRHGWAAQCLMCVRNAFSVRMNIERQ